MTALVVTWSGDNAAPDRVLAALAARGVDAARLDTDRFPGDVRLALDPTLGRGHLVLPDRVLALSGLRAAWVRRLAVGHAAPDDGPPGERAACLGESRAALVGTLDGLGCPVVGRPCVVAAARDKVRQLRLAAAAGLAVPPTRVTNDPAAVRALAAGGPLVAKMLHAFALDDEVVFTSPVSATDLADLSGLARAPMVFQRAVPAVEELRVTVVGGRLYVAGLARSPDEAPDWRRDAAARAGAWGPATLSEGVAAGVRRVVADLGLSYAAVDLLRDADGTCWFLEANPAGEWLWLQDAGLDIAGGLAELLSRGGG